MVKTYTCFILLLENLKFHVKLDSTLFLRNLGFENYKRTLMDKH